MRYWWVNQNRTYRHEVGGGYLWSPKRNNGGGRNPYYQFMREVSPGDIVFSFSDALIAAVGIARSYCYESPQPTEFGKLGATWEQVGWKVDVSFQELINRVRPKDHIDHLVPFLPQKYSPLLANGNGLQSVYLAEIGAGFASVLFSLIGTEASTVRETAGAVAVSNEAASTAEPTLDEWEQQEEEAILSSSSLAETQRLALVQARRGQGQFRSNVSKVETSCRITKVDRKAHLVASHIKPWRDSDNADRLNGENGLLLTPTIDHLFDKGFISFENRGRLLISPVAHNESLRRMGVSVDEIVNVGSFSEAQRAYLDYHRSNVFRSADLGSK